MPGNIPKGYHLPSSTKLVVHTHGRSLNIEPCPKGTYNDEIQEHTFKTCKNCPAGQFGGITGLQSNDCSGPCNAGTYCPARSESMTLKCEAGYYGSTGAHETSTCQGPCPEGYWCEAGSTGRMDQKCAGTSNARE